MAPNSKTGEEHMYEDSETSVAPKSGSRSYQIIYPNLITFGYGHIAALYGLYLCFTSAKWPTIFLGWILLVVSELGITAGAHRLWTHKTYKAKLPLEIILLIFNTVAFQNSAIHWIRDHRLHHKHSDTEADPHNARRGFFFSHMGWLLVKKNDEVRRRGKEIDMSDIYSNPLLTFQKKYAIPLVSLITFIIPTLIPMYFWGETLNNSWHITVLRYVLNLQLTFLVNSAAHYWGSKPYDKNMVPAQNTIVSILACGEGYHNYHHVFPWDYRTAELGNNILNVTTMFIDFFAWIGWAYDLKTASDEMIKNRKERTGDGTNLWGWGDQEQSGEEKKAATILYKQS